MVSCVCIVLNYIVGAKYTEATQLKLLKLVPYRKYQANTVSRVSKLATFFMVNTQSAESPLSGLHTVSWISFYLFQ